MIFLNEDKLRALIKLHIDYRLNNLALENWISGMKLSSEDLEWMQRVQLEWHQRLKPNSTHLGHHLFDVPMRLAQTAVNDARLYADRFEALRYFSKGGRVAEVGTQAGWYAEKISETVAPDELHLFDLDFELLKLERPEFSRRPNITLHQGDSSKKLAMLPDNYFDWIYIDGDHALEGVRKDAAVAVRKIKMNGILVFNDYTPWSIMELSDYGVMPIVHELLHGSEWKVAYLALHRQMYCDLAIKRA
jgi:ubiquinone/menaquinone biosynthesis C-methylase UbiE